MELVKQITAEELGKIKAGQKDLQTALFNIGVAEAQKHDSLHQLAELNKTIEEYKNVMEEKYGAININLEDGAYTSIVKEGESSDEIPFEEVK